MKHIAILLFPLMLIALLGCGSGNVMLRGQVVFSDDGSPVPVGTIIFSTSTFTADGRLDAQGNFTMGSLSDRDGLPPGTYTVKLIGAMENLTDDPTSLVGRPYSLTDPNWEDTIVVERGMRTIEIRVDRNPQPRPR